jgi:hypothetical protein
MQRQSCLHRITAWTAILGYALLASGLPLPFGSEPPVTDPAVAKRLAGKDRSRPFPCMDKPCGCATAEQCFANCCCHTPAERLAWAKAHDVEHSLLAALERRVSADAAQEAGGCCSTKKTVPSCCASKSAPEPAQEHEQEDAPRSKSVVLRAMLACGGIVAQWFAAGCSLPPPIVECRFPFPCIGCLAVVDEFDEQPHFSPAAPPPRAG